MKQIRKGDTHHMCHSLAQKENAIKNLLEAFCPAPLHVVAPEGVFHSMAGSVYLAEDEILNGVTIGDLVEDELGTLVGYNDIVAFSSEYGSASYQAGAILGDLIVRLVKSHQIPVENDTKASFILSAYLGQLVESDPSFLMLGLHVEDFQYGLGSSMCHYWMDSHPNNHPSPIFSAPDFFRYTALRSYLSVMEPAILELDLPRVKWSDIKQTLKQADIESWIRVVKSELLDGLAGKPRDIPAVV